MKVFYMVLRLFYTYINRKLFKQIILKGDACNELIAF